MSATGWVWRVMIRGHRESRNSIDALIDACGGRTFDPALVLDPSVGFVEWNETHPPI
jgi:hypothetical protein